MILSIHMATRPADDEQETERRDLPPSRPARVTA